MSPILVRPIREQFEHNRVIRLLVARFRRKFAVAVNIGDEPEATGVRSGTDMVYPDLVLTNTQGARRLHGIVEVETSESVNHLEAMAEWAPYSRVRGAFYLYVPAGSTDVARRLCEGSQVAFTEIWSYHAVGDQMRFTLTHRSAAAVAASKRSGKVAREAAAESASGAKSAAKKTRASGKKANLTPAARKTAAAGKKAGASTKPARGATSKGRTTQTAVKPVSATAKPAKTRAVKTRSRTRR